MYNSTNYIQYLLLTLSLYLRIIEPFSGSESYVLHEATEKVLVGIHPLADLGPSERHAAMFPVDSCDAGIDRISLDFQLCL